MPKQPKKYIMLCQNCHYGSIESLTEEEIDQNGVILCRKCEYYNEISEFKPLLLTN